MKNAKRLLRKLDYLPRWAWYAMSLAIGGPVGPVVVYVAFHALQKAADDEDAEYDEWSTDSERREGGYADADCTVTDGSLRLPRTPRRAAVGRDGGRRNRRGERDHPRGARRHAPHPPRQRPDPRPGAFRAD